MAMIAGGKGKPLVLRHPYNTLIDPHRPECKTFMQKLGNDPVVMRSGKTGQETHDKKFDCRMFAEPDDRLDCASCTIMVLHGGCLCRSVRYAVGIDAVEGSTNFCHCRMCQLTTGSPVGAFVTVSEASLSFEGSASIGVYQSSEKAIRKFCKNCGTPLVYKSTSEQAAEIDLYTTTLDEPDVAAPAYHIWTESKRPWLQLSDDLPKHEQERPGS